MALTGICLAYAWHMPEIISLGIPDAKGHCVQIGNIDFPSIQGPHGYALVENTLLLLQPSISETHSTARHEDVKEIIRLARCSFEGDPGGVYRP
jgi:hypothetical protein